MAMVRRSSRQIGNKQVINMVTLRVTGYYVTDIGKIFKAPHWVLCFWWLQLYLNFVLTHRILGSC